MCFSLSNLVFLSSTLNLLSSNPLPRSMIPRYMGSALTERADSGDGAWPAEAEAEAAAFEAVGGARPKRPSLPGNLGNLEPDDERLLEVSEDLETQSDAGAGFLASRYLLETIVTCQHAA
jgi:hypothetical protein